MRLIKRLSIFSLAFCFFANPIMGHPAQNSTQDDGYLADDDKLPDDENPTGFEDWTDDEASVDDEDNDLVIQSEGDAARMSLLPILYVLYALFTNATQPNTSNQIQNGQ